MPLPQAGLEFLGLYEGFGIEYTPFDVEIAGGTSEIRSAVAGNRIRILSLVLASDINMTARLENSGSGTHDIVSFELLAGNTVVLPYQHIGWGETRAGLALVLNAVDAGTAQLTGVCITCLVLGGVPL